MALSNIADWSEDKAASACGAACGASDKNVSDGNVEEKPAACGASDKNASDGNMEEKPSACGSACGAGDNK